MKRFLAVISIAFVSLVLPLAPLHAAAVAITAGNVAASSNAVYLQGDHFANAAITAGQAVYVNSTVTNPSTSNPDIGLASASGTGDAVKVVGIAINGAGVGQPVRVVVRDSSFTLGGTIAAGDILELHTTAGAVTVTAADVTTGQYVSVLGVGIGGNKVNLGGSQSPGVSTGAKFIGAIRADVPK